MSTGIIGEFMPMEKIEKGIAAAAEKLANNDASFDAAARGILTTDTVKKVASRTLTLTDKEVRLVGFAKGAAMIGPNMATMLGLLLTDAPPDGRFGSANAPWRRPTRVSTVSASKGT